MYQLIKIHFQQAFASLKKGKNSNRGVILFGVMFSLVAICMGVQFYGMAANMPDPKFLLFTAGISALFFLLFSLVLQSQNFFFKTKDYELLASMPIRHFTIVLAKSVAALLTCYLYQSIILIPALVGYFVVAGFQVGMFFAFLLGFILFPLFPLAISFCISLLTHLIMSKTKHQTIVNYVLMVVMFAGFFLSFYLFSNDILGNMNIFKCIFPSVYFFFIGISANFVYIVYLLLLSIAAIILTLYLISISYRKINQGFTATSYKKKEIHLEVNSFSYLKFEAKRYFSLPMYVFNTIIGPILILLIPFMKFIGPGFADPYTYTIIICLLLSMSITTACSISLEGSKINLLKSLPLRPGKLFWNKILFNILLTLPALFICDILILSLNQFAWYEMIEMVIIPLLAIITFSTLGLLINLYFPKLDFSSVTQVVKQSLSVFISIFSGLVLNFVFLFTMPMTGLATWLNMLIYAGVLILVLAGSVLVLYKQGVKKFKELYV